MPLCPADILKDISSTINPAVNPYVAKMTAALADGSLPVLQGTALKDCRGQWRETFARLRASNSTPNQSTPDQSTPDHLAPGIHSGGRRKLIVEIGCHLGLTLNQMAKNYHDADFIGMDITFKRVVTAAERAVAQRHHNVATVLGNARAMDAIFADGEVDGFIVFFPDPWLKRAKNKNRLVDREFSALLTSKLSPGGFVWMKTDQEVYFQEAREGFLKAGLEPTESVDFFAGHLYESTFERRFRLQGLSPHGGHWQKPHNGRMC